MTVRQHDDYESVNTANEALAQASGGTLFELRSQPCLKVALVPRRGFRFSKTILLRELNNKRSVCAVAVDLNAGAGFDFTGDFHVVCSSV
jgi:hypothetical protein